MRLLVLNQYYPPDRAATATLLGQLASDLSATFDVTVLCGTPTYAPESAIPTQPNRLRVIRIPLWGASRSRIVWRIVNYLFFMIGASVRACLLPAPHIVLCWTDPPIVGILGVLLQRLRKSRLVFVCQDVYPEVAVAMNRMNNPVARGILAVTGRAILRSADAVVAVGVDMRERLIGKGCPPEKIRLIPNWQDLDLLRPAIGGTFRRKQGVPEGSFVVMHSGNIGFSQDFDTLLEAAARTIDDPGIVYFIIGDGGREREIRSRVERIPLPNVRILPYQPTSDLAETLSGADLHYVSLHPRLTGFIVPSKLYGILAVARPILANVGGGSEVERVLREAACGLRSNGTAADLAATIVDAKKRREELLRMGENGRTWSERNGGRHRAREAYIALLQEVGKG